MGTCGFTLPCQQTISDPQDALSVTNQGPGAALAGTSAGGPGVHGTNGAGSAMAVPTVSGVWGDSDNNFGVHGTSNGAGVRGESTGGFGVHGSSQTNDGVMGDSAANGVHGVSTSSANSGVRGENAGGGYGVSGLASTSAATEPAGVWGDNGGYGAGVRGTSRGVGVYGSAEGTGVYGESDSFRAVAGESNTGVGVYGRSNTAEGVRGESTEGDGVHGESQAGDHAGVAAINHASGFFGNALFAHSDNGNGAWAEGRNGIIVKASPAWTHNAAVFAQTQSDESIAVYGYKDAGVGGYAGYFYGPVMVAGGLSKLGGGFKIDHPLDPAGKYLSHSFVESPEMKNVYDGVVALNARGQATVKLPTWFESLNRDFRYQLTPIGAPAPDLHIAKGVSGNAFTIAGGKPRMQVSWQVTGVRKDAWAEKNRIVAEAKKAPRERGYYLDPIAHGKPASMAIAERHRPDQVEPKKGLKPKAKPRGPK
jgi:hypothetical protein